MPRKLTPDLWLFALVVVLVSVGVVMVYSASAIVAAERFHDPFFFLREAALLGGGGLRLSVDGHAPGLPAARALRDPAARRVLRAPRPRARAALRPGDQRHAPLVPERARLVPAGGAREVRPRALSRVLPHAAAGGGQELLAGAPAAADGRGPDGGAHRDPARSRQQPRAHHPDDGARVPGGGTALAHGGRRRAPPCPWWSCSSR